MTTGTGSTRNDPPLWEIWKPVANPFAFAIDGPKLKRM